jgi:hypothetical protein
VGSLQDPARKKRQQMSRQICKAGTDKEETWKICKLKICCPRNKKNTTDKQTDVRQI